MKQFIQGCLLGLASAFVALAVAIMLLHHSGALAIDPARYPTLASLANWALGNLGGSLFAFILLTGWFIYGLIDLLFLLKSTLKTDPEQVQATAVSKNANGIRQAEQRLDIVIALVFGAGVIWTAIGMRGALIHALGDGGAAISRDAADVLQRLVSGGMLVALSSTVVGGILGYLMRVIRQLVAGPSLMRWHQYQSVLQMKQLARYIAEEQQGKASSLAANVPASSVAARVTAGAQFPPAQTPPE